MRASLKAPKKVVVLFEAMPLLTLVLPFVGQHWNDRAWSFCYFLLFIPFFARYHSTFITKGKRRTMDPEWPFFYLAYFVGTQMMGWAAYVHRASIGEAILYAVITLFILSNGVLLARYLKAKDAEKLRQWNQKMGF